MRRPNEDLSEDVVALINRITDQARRRERRYVAMAMMFALLAAGGLAGTWYGFDSSRTVIQEDVTAQQELDRTVDMVDTLLGRMASDLGQLGDMPDDRLAEMLARAESGFEELVAGREADRPRDALREAELFNRFSSAYLALGDPQRALEASSQATAVLDSAGDEASSREGSEELAVALIHEGDARSELNDHAGALSAYRRATALREGLMAAAPDDGELRRRLSIVYEREGQALAATGSHDDAVGRLSQAIAIREELATGTAAGTDALEALAVAYAGLADVEAHRGRVQQAAELYGQTIDTYDRLAEVDDDTAWRERMAMYMARLGRVQLAADSPSAGLDTLGRAAGAYRELIAIRPGDEELEARLAETLEWTGLGYLERHDLPAARAALMGSLDIRRQLADEGRGTVEHQRAFARSLIELAEVDRAERLDDAGRARVGEAIGIYRDIRSLEPASAGAAADLARALTVGADFGIEPTASLEEALEIVSSVDGGGEAEAGTEFSAIADDIRSRLDDPSQ